MDEYKSFLIEKRFKETSYDSIISELCRDDLNGRWLIPYLPDQSDVNKCIEDSASIRFFIYTRKYI